MLTCFTFSAYFSGHQRQRKKFYNIDTWRLGSILGTTGTSGRAGRAFGRTSGRFFRRRISVWGTWFCRFLRFLTRVPRFGTICLWSWWRPPAWFWWFHRFFRFRRILSFFRFSRTLSFFRFIRILSFFRFLWLFCFSRFLWFCWSCKKVLICLQTLKSCFWHLRESLTYAVLKHP